MEHGLIFSHPGSLVQTAETSERSVNIRTKTQTALPFRFQLGLNDEKRAICNLLQSLPGSCHSMTVKRLSRRYGVGQLLEGCVTRPFCCDTVVKGQHKQRLYSRLRIKDLLPPCPGIRIVHVKHL